MADAATLRKYAFDNGRGNVKGRLPRALITEWNTLHPDDIYDQADPPLNSVPPVEDDFEAMFPGDGGAWKDEPPEDTAETPPKKVTRGRTAKRTGLSGLFGGKDTGGRKKKQPRVSTEDLLGSLWRGAAKLATPLPPLHRTLRVQAPVAGLLLDDAVKDTVADTLLQPLARFAHTGRTVSALIGPPAFVTAITLHLQQATSNGEQPNPLFMAIATEGLRGSLMTWMDVAGPKFEEAIKREKEFEEKYGSDVDEFMNWLFSAVPATAEEAEHEEGMYARATGQAA